MAYGVSGDPVDEGDSAAEGSGKKPAKPVHVISVVNYCCTENCFIHAEKRVK